MHQVVEAGTFNPCPTGNLGEVVGQNARGHGDVITIAEEGQYINASGLKNPTWFKELKEYG
jgi:hypothetical protein